MSSPKWKSRVGKHRCFRYLVSRRKLVLVIVFLCICLAVLKLKMQGNLAKVSSSDVCIATVEDEVGAGLHYSDFQESQSSQGPSLPGQHLEACLLAVRVCPAGGCGTRHTFFFFRDFHLFSEMKSKHIFLKLL